MLDIKFRIRGTDVIIKLNRGVHLCGTDSGTGKTYFAKLVQCAVEHNLVNAAVINLKNINFVSQMDLDSKDLIVIDSASAIDLEGKLEHLLEQVKDKYVIMDMKEYRYDFSFKYDHVWFTFEKDRLEVSDWI